MAKEPENCNKRWTQAEEKQLRDLAEGNTPTGLISNKLGRTEDGIRARAVGLDVSLKPTNQSPYNPRK